MHDGDTPLHQAAFNNHVGCLQVLLQDGRADLAMPASSIPQWWPKTHRSDRANMPYTLINACKGDGKTALHLAVLRGALPAVETLIVHGACKELMDLQECTPVD